MTLEDNLLDLLVDLGNSKQYGGARGEVNCPSKIDLP